MKMLELLPLCQRNDAAGNHVLMAGRGLIRKDGIGGPQEVIK
jgi:hypothetical protein